MLVIEAPFVVAGLFCLRLAKTRRSMIAVALIGFGLSLLPALNIGSSRNDFERGSAIAWPVGALIVIVSHLMANQKNSGGRTSRSTQPPDPLRVEFSP